MTTPQQLQAARKISALLATARGRTIPEVVEVLEEALEALDPELPAFKDLDLVNRFLIGVSGTADRQLFNFTLRPSPMTRDEALVVAAWLIVLADPRHERFPTIERMVRNT
jgi:actin-like ATPase involved in cell morphogenesis